MFIIILVFPPWDCPLVRVKKPRFWRDLQATPRWALQWADPIPDQHFDPDCEIRQSILVNASMAIIIPLYVISPVFINELSQLRCCSKFLQLHKAWGYRASGGNERARWRSNATGEAQSKRGTQPVKPRSWWISTRGRNESSEVMWLEHSATFFGCT